MTGMKDAVEWNTAETAVRFPNLLGEQRWCWANLCPGKILELSKSLCKSTRGVMGSKFCRQLLKPNKCSDVQMLLQTKPFLC